MFISILKERNQSLGYLLGALLLMWRKKNRKDRSAYLILFLFLVMGETIAHWCANGDDEIGNKTLMIPKIKAEYLKQCPWIRKRDGSRTQMEVLSLDWSMNSSSRLIKVKYEGRDTKCIGYL